MKISVLTMIKNEQDIVEPFVRHNLQYADNIFIVDDSSKDKTSEILMALREEGLPIHLYSTDEHLHGGLHVQSEVMTQLFQIAAKIEYADIYVFLDADEFLHHSSGRLGWERELQALHHLEVLYLPWVNHIVPPNAKESYFNDIPRSFKYFMTQPSKTIFKTAVRVYPTEPTPPLIIDQGNHHIFCSHRGLRAILARLVGKATYRKLNGNNNSEISLHHYPIRSSDQIFQKAVLGWLANIKKYPSARQQNIAHHWGKMFDFFMDNDRLDTSELYSLSMRRAAPNLDPAESISVTDVEYSYEKKYTELGETGLRVMLAELESRAKAEGQASNQPLNKLLSKFTRWKQGGYVKALQ